jgi:transcriptional regulator with XRE-family HTH domain
MSRDKTLNDIGKRLHAARGELDQRALASLAHVSQQAVSNYERGNLPASWSFLRRLNEELGLNLNWLFSGHGSRELGSGGLCAALADNRSAEWPREFVAQVAFHSASPLEVPLSLYFLYLATEPADAKARLMADVQAVVEAARQSLESSEGGADPGLLEVLGALAGDDRRLAVEALIAAGESMERGRAAAGARRAYLAALGIARLQRWPGEEVEAARRVGRTYRKEGRWDEAERFFELALSSVSSAESHGVEPGGKAGVPPATAARAFLGAGHAARQSGNVVAARDRYRRALEWALRTDELALGAEVHLELPTAIATGARHSTTRRPVSSWPSRPASGGSPSTCTSSRRSSCESGAISKPRSPPSARWRGRPRPNATWPRCPWCRATWRSCSWTWDAPTRPSARSRARRPLPEPRASPEGRRSESS